MSDRKGRDRDEKQREAAVQIALRTGLLKQCSNHGDVYTPGQHDYQGASMVVSFLINRDDPLVAPFDGDRAALMEMLKSICGTYPANCAGCVPQPPS